MKPFLDQVIEGYEKELEIAKEKLDNLHDDFTRAEVAAADLRARCRVMQAHVDAYSAKLDEARKKYGGLITVPEKRPHSHH